MASAVSMGELVALRPLLDWLPGETLFSLCSRYHFISGHRTPAQTCATLFGSHRAGSAHDVPSHVQTLVDRTHGALGTAREIILERTLLPFYFPFHPAPKSEHWLTQIATGSSPVMKAQLGLAASQFGASHPLKACPVCMQLDQSGYGVAYWHVEHQVPGVHICQVHRKPLLVATDKVSGRDRFGWILPQQARLQSSMDEEFFWNGDHHLLAESALAFWRLPRPFAFSPEKLDKLYLSELVRLEIAHHVTSRIDQIRFDQTLYGVIAANSLTKFWPWLASTKGLRSLSARLRRMVHPTSPRISRHPLIHLFWIALLFDSWQDFWSAYNNNEYLSLYDIAPAGKTTGPTMKGVGDSGDPRRARLVEAVRSGKSISTAAKQSGVTVATAMSWAAREGIASPRRPKVLSPDVRAQLIKQLQRGIDKTIAASAAGISVESVTRVLLTEPGLHAQWREARFSRMQEQSRGSWRKIVEAFPTSSSSDWRKLDPAVYAWLYRNDRTWLQTSIRERSEPLTVATQRRDWKTRDAVLAQAVRLTALEWHVAHPGKRMTIGIICETVGGLRQKMSAIAKLPLTRMALLNACSHSLAKASTSQKTVL